MSGLLPRGRNKFLLAVTVLDEKLIPNAGLFWSDHRIASAIAVCLGGKCAPRLTPVLSRRLPKILSFADVYPNRAIRDEVQAK